MPIALKKNATTHFSTQVKRQIVFTPVSRLEPAERNARMHSPHQISQIARSIEHYGFINPILVDVDGRLAPAAHVPSCTALGGALPDPQAAAGNKTANGGLSSDFVEKISRAWTRWLTT